MRLDLLSVVLRQRDPWEATDLGIALWRRHFGALLRAWLALSLPVLVLVTAFAWSIGQLWLAWLLMWWLKPWFDRVPLYVLSRAVFGTVLGTPQVLRARELYAPGLLAWLSWRRLQPARALLLPVDLLEGVTGARRAARSSVLLRAVGAQSFGLLATCLTLEFACLLSLLSVGLLFVPTEFLSESARAVWATMLQTPPRWAQLLMLGLWWLSVSLVEPIYVAAGFGLYLHRRTQLEAWDLELVFRRLALRARELAAAAAALLAVALLCGSLAYSPAALAAPGQDAACAKPCPEAPRMTPAQLLGKAARAPDPAFERALDRAFTDPSLARTQKFTHWVLRTPLEKQKEEAPPAWLLAIIWVVSAVAEYGVWIAAAVLLLVLLWHLPRWLPWVRRQLREETVLPQIVEQAVPESAPLPDDVPTAVSALWREGRQRDALALLYRAGVVRLSERLGTAFPPGATEADCLRRARRLDDAAARDSFGAVVRTWQRAAYARQFPDSEAFAELLSAWSQRFPVVRGMKRQHLLIIGLGLALLAAVAVFLFPRVFKQVTDDLPLPATGEAAYNPLYALKLALHAHGQKVSSWPNLAAAEHALGKRDTLLLFDRPEAMGNAQAQRIVAWVQGGGHLLMPGPPGEASAGPLAGALGLRAMKAPPEDSAKKLFNPRAGCVRVLAPGESALADHGAWLCDSPFLPAVPGFELAGGDDAHGYRFARRMLGEGEVTVVELDFLDNEGLRDAAARELAFQLLAPGFGEGRMHLVYSADVPSLLHLLIKHAWMVLLPLLLALGAWLAMRGQRFGPLQPAPEPRRRALLEHVRAAGEFTWGRQRASALHAAVLRLFQQRLQRRAPEIDALAGDAQVLALANATQLPTTRVRQALRPQGLQQPAVFTQSIATLLQMRSRL